MENNFYREYGAIISKIAIGVGILLALFLLVLTFGKLKEYRFIGSGLDATNTISVTGQGKVEKAPDTARVTFSVQNEAKDVVTAQKTVSDKVDAVTKALKDLGIEEKDIKTDSYNSYPQYNYPQKPCYSNGICESSAPTLRGYQVSHTVTVAVKDLTLTDKVLGVLGTQGVTDISGPNFGFEDDKVVAREARDAAIADAKLEAQKLADSLGVKLVRIVSFSENGGGYPMPMYARDSMTSGGAVKVESAPALPIGSEKVDATVTIVYEIR